MSDIGNTRPFGTSGSLLALTGDDIDPVERHRRARILRESRASLLQFSPDHVMGGDDQPIQHDDDERPAGSRLRRILMCTAAGGALGLALGLALPSSYIATVRLSADSSAADLFGGAMTDSQLQSLTSETVLGAVVDRLSLDDDPEYNGGRGLFSNLADLVLPGDPTVHEPRTAAVDNLRDSLAVESTDEGIALSAGSSDAEKSALVANTVAEVFVGTGQQATESAADRVVDADARLAALRNDLEAAEEAVEAYRAEHGLLGVQNGRASEDEIARLDEQLSAAREKSMELNARAATAREADVDTVVTGSLPEQVASPVLAGLRGQYSLVQQQADGMSVRLGPRHPERQAVEAQLDGLRGRIAEELRRTSASIQVELKRAVQQEQELASRLAQLREEQRAVGPEEQGLRQLEREAEARRTAYEEMQGAGSSGMDGTDNFRIVSAAEAPLEANGPSLMQTTLAGALAGLLIGVGLAMSRWPVFHGHDEEEHFEAETTVEEVNWNAAATDPVPAATADAVATEPPKQEGSQQMYHDKQASQLYGQPQHAPAQPVHSHPAYAYPQAVGYPPAPPMQPQARPHWQQAQPAYPYPQPGMMSPPPAAYGYPAQAYPYPPAMQPAWGYPAPMADPYGYYAPEPYAPQQEAMDPRTEAAIEEIRASLREFREAIQDFAEARDPDNRRYGT